MITNEYKKLLKTYKTRYCLCHNVYEHDEFLIGCDLCDGWYHIECMNLKSKNMHNHYHHLYVLY